MKFSWIFCIFFSLPVCSQINNYEVVDQVWTTSNTTIKVFQNDDPIPFAKNSTEFEIASRKGQPAWCYPGFDPANEKIYGLLYNHYVLTDSRGFAPEGWRIPSLEDFEKFKKFHGGFGSAGARIIDNGSNCGFNAVFAGTSSGDAGKVSAFWLMDPDAEKFWYFHVEKNSPLLNKHSYPPGIGLTVRFIKDKNIVHQENNYVKIGNQEWSTQNLSATKFRNGEALQLCTKKEEWIHAARSKTPAYCYYNFDEKNHGNFGVIYNYYAITDEREIVPEDAHIPNLEEWKELTDQLRNNSAALIAGKKLKSDEFWIQRNYCAKSEREDAGFNALGGGYCHANGKFPEPGYITGFWIRRESDSEPLHSFNLTAGYDHFSIEDITTEQGFYVRYLRNTVNYEMTSKVYGSIVSSSFTFMNENLSVTRYRNGDPIPEAKNKEQWLEYEAAGKGAWCFLNFDPATEKKSGRLYNIFAVRDPRNIAPEGWRIPHKTEFEQLCFDKNVRISLYNSGGGSYSMSNTFEPEENKWWALNPEKPKKKIYIVIRDTDSHSQGFTTATNLGCFIRCIKEN